MTSIVLLLPAALLLLVFLAYPVLQNVGVSFEKWDGIGTATFVGLRNYATALASPRLWTALTNTIIFAVATAAGTIVAGFILAAAIYSRVPGSSVYRFVFFIPVLIPLTMTAIVWQLALDPTEGPVNRLLMTLGVGEPPQWLADPNQALLVTILATIWQYSGFAMIVLLAAMDRISPEIQDAASVDGVTTWQRLWHITLPMTARVLTVLTTLFLISGLKIFDLIFVMTGGGPGQATSVLGTLIYNEAFNRLAMGYAASIAVIATVIIVGFSLIYLRLVSGGVRDHD